MNDLTTIQLEVIEYYKRTEKRGKWYQHDVEDFTIKILKETNVEKLKRQLNNMGSC